MSTASDLNHFAYEAVTSYDSALNNFFIAANRLHLCAEPVSYTHLTLPTT